MCDVKRCRLNDVEVIYSSKVLITYSNDVQQLDDSVQYEICRRCWAKHGDKPAREILALLK
jgi:hypothetical protein